MPKKILKIVLIILLSPIVLVLVLFIFFSIVNPIWDKFDRDKFITLDTQMQKVFNDIKTASNGMDEWKDITVCSADYEAWMTTGVYNCVASISTQKDVTSVQEINDLQSKYYPVIDNNNVLKQKNELNPQFPYDFGKNFVVSGAEKDYTELKSGVECRYSLLLYQKENLGNHSPNSYGSKLDNGAGRAIVSIRCQDKARKSWYTLSGSAELLIPS